MRKLVACLACRNQGSRLYGKPLQNLDIEKGLTILDYIIASLKKYGLVDAIVLGISEGAANEVFREVAESRGVDYIVGSENDVLKRLIQCCEKAEGTDIFRITTESPFNFWEGVTDAWERHVGNNNDLTCLDNVPDGSGIEIISLKAYQRSWAEGEDRHRSEYCSLFIRENKDKFRIEYLDAPAEIKRTDIRLTVDYPEDLVLCRAVYNHFRDKAPLIPLSEIIAYLDSRPDLKGLVDQFVEEGLKTMYI